MPFRRINRRAITLIAVHAAIFAIAFFLAFFVRNDFKLESWLPTYLATVAGLIAVKLAVFYLLGHCHASWTRVAFGDLTNLLWGATLSMLVLASIDSFVISTGWLGVPRVQRSVILLDWACTILLIGGMRAVYRSVREELRPLFSGRPARSAIIVGANRSGELIARNLMAASQNPYFILGFLDDDPHLKHSRVAGIEVLGSVDEAGVEVSRRRVDDVIVQSGTLTGKRFRRLLDECTAAGATVKVLPAIDELLNGQSDPSHVRLRSVEIKDLLRREPVKLDDSAIRALIAGRTIMVTGAGG
jgi:FlaA1/EpsC-like NDP-sugar epimerase